MAYEHSQVCLFHPKANYWEYQKHSFIPYLNYQKLSFKTNFITDEISLKLQ